MADKPPVDLDELAQLYCGLVYVMSQQTGIHQWLDEMSPDRKADILDWLDVNSADTDLAFVQNFHVLVNLVQTYNFDLESEQQQDLDGPRLH